MKLILYIGGALALVGLPQWCLACNPVCRVTHAKVVVVPTAAAVATVAVTFVEVPLYSVGPVVQAGAIPTAPLALPGARPPAAKAVAKPAAKPDTATKPPEALAAPAHPGLALMVRYCAGCHEAKVAEVEGKGFVLLSGGSLAPLTDKQKFKVLKNLNSGRMPKLPEGQKLDDNDFNALLDFVDGWQ